MTQYTLRMFCGITEAQFSDFQNLFREAQFCCSRQAANLRETRICHYCCKKQPPVLGGKSNNACKTGGSRNSDQPQDAEVVAEAKYPSAYPSCSPARARRNFLKLLARYPEIARRLNLSLADAYPPL